MRRAFKNVAIVGGGPGGLFTAKLLDDFPEKFVRTTIFEASPRLGGKVLTRSFGSAAALFEAGVAELYDYSHLGSDPLKELVLGLDLETIPMAGRTVILDEKIVNDADSFKRHFGIKAEAEVANFYRSCARLYSPNESRNATKNQFMYHEKCGDHVGLADRVPLLAALALHIGGE